MRAYRTRRSTLTVQHSCKHVHVLVYTSTVECSQTDTATGQDDRSRACGLKKTPAGLGKQLWTDFSPWFGPVDLVAMVGAKEIRPWLSVEDRRIEASNLIFVTETRAEFQVVVESHEPVPTRIDKCSELSQLSNNTMVTSTRCPWIKKVEGPLAQLVVVVAQQV